MRLEEKVDPPGLPEWAPEVGGPRSSWDVLAETIIRAHGYSTHETRVVWVRYAWFSWHCGQRMRVARLDYRVRGTKFGWEQNPFKYAACVRCGYTKWIL